MRTITLTDNDYKGTSFADAGITEEDERDLRRIADIDISELRLEEHPNLIVFPPNIKNARDEIGSGQICSIHGEKIHTGNVMGFISVGNTQLAIKSRFAQSGGEDYFMHYMLCRVLSLNVFSLNHNYNEQPLLDFLIYLFPTYLLAAYSQGVFKTYQRKQYNEARARGAIDVARHIRQNIPFLGKVAFNTRELSYDNSVTQLVRHTIEYIEAHKYGAGILSQTEDLRNAMSTFKEATPSYNRHNRTTVINQNIRPLAHPYYTAYTALQRLCVQILRHEGLKYGDGERDVYGILFDGAWLWEEYLNTLMRQHNFTHAENKLGWNGIKLFKGYPLYPDFYKNDIVIDAKYKGSDSGSNRNDLMLIVTYMHVLPASIGGFAYPSVCEYEIHNMGKLEGLGGRIVKIPLLIPQQTSGIVEFNKQMERSESRFLQNINRMQAGNY